MSQLEQYDQLFFDIFDKMEEQIVQNTRQALFSVMDVIMEFTQEGARKALQDFRKLYFTKQDMHEISESINKNVDDLLDQLQADHAAGKDLDASFNEDETAAQDRLALSAMQKELEGIITLDVNMRNQLVPVMWGMKFEELVTEQLGGIRKLIQHGSSQDRSGADLEQDKEKSDLKDLLTEDRDIERFTKVMS